MKKYIINGKEIELLDGLIGDNGRIIYPVGSDDTSNKINEIIQALGTPVPEPKKEFKRWRAEKDEKYYFVSEDRRVYYNIEGFIPAKDYNYYQSGNYYKTQGLAQIALDKQIALTKLNDIIMEKNEGWVADWSNFEQEKYTLEYVSTENKFTFNAYNSLNGNPFILLIKAGKIAGYIIKNHKDLLDTIWGVESK